MMGSIELGLLEKAAVITTLIFFVLLFVNEMVIRPAFWNWFHSKYDLGSNYSLKVPYDIYNNTTYRFWIHDGHTVYHGAATLSKAVQLAKQSGYYIVRSPR